MEHYSDASANIPRPGLVGSYVGMLLPVVVGAALGLGIYFFVASKNGEPGQGTTTADRLCACPNCGMTIPKPPGLDCEEVTCPNCGIAMNNAARLAAAPVMTQNRRETLAEQGVVAPGPITQNQRETLVEQGISIPTQHPTNPNIAAFTPPLRDEFKCVCPNCGKTIDKQPGVPCSHVRCPNCQTVMTNSIPVGGQPDLQLVGMGGLGNLFGNGDTQAAAAAPCPGGVGRAQAGGGAACPGAAANNAPQSNAQTVTYTNTVQGIIHQNCLRCHGGPIRTLTTYDQVKAYADNGLLLMMTQPGGPMSRFLSAHESHQISAWIKAGAPR